jgi:hypothetical protein
MSLPNCAVTTTVYLQDGTIDFTAAVRARLSHGERDDGFVTAGDVYADADPDTGLITLMLWPNQRGSTSSYYRITVEGADRTENTTAVVPDVETIELADICALPPYPGKSEAELGSDVAAAVATEVATDLAPYTGDTQPTYRFHGRVWNNTVNGRTYTWIVDGDTSQWVEFGGVVYADDPVTVQAAVDAKDDAEDAQGAAEDAQAAAEAAQAAAAAALAQAQFATYAALSAYTGSAVTAFVTGANIAGPFLAYPADTTTPVNAGTVLARANGGRWKRPDEPVNLDWFPTVQDALTWRRSTNGKMRVPPKLYQHASGLVIENQTHVDKAFILEGEGYNASPTQGGSCFQYTGTTGAALSIIGTTADNQDGTFRMSEFAVHGASTAAGNTAGAVGIDADHVNNAVLENLHVGYHGGHGFSGHLCFSLEIRRGLYFDNFGSGLYFNDAPNRVKLVGGESFGNGRDASTINQGNIFIFGNSGGYAPVIDDWDVSYAGRLLYAWGAGEVSGLSSITVTGGVATVNTLVPHGLSTGNIIAVKLAATAGLRTSYYGAAVTVVDADTFTYAVSAANGSYTIITDPDLVIGTHSNGALIFATYGMQIKSLYCENAMGNGLYVYSDNRAMEVEGGFMLNCPVVFDGAQDCSIGGMHFQGAGAVLYIAEASQRASINFKRSTCSFTSGATFSRGAFYMEDGIRYGSGIPTTGTWRVGEVLVNSAPGVGGVWGWECVVAGVPAPGSFVALGQIPMCSGNWGDSAVTLTVGASYTTNLWLSPLTADRVVTLSTTNAFAGAKFRITRAVSSTGAFSLTVGAGLKALAAGQWCDVEFNGTTWGVVASGSL